MPKYEKKITLGRDSEGRLVRRSIYAHTKPELEKKIFEARQAYLTENASPSNDFAFGSFALQWLKTEKAHVGINTRAMYSNVIERHLMPAIGSLYFSEIGQEDLQAILDDNFEKSETCNKIKLTLRQIFAAANDAEIEVRKGVNIKKLIAPKKEKNEKRALTAAEKSAIFAADLPAPERVFLLMLFYCGLRREECLALEVGDIDIKKRFVHVRRALIFDGNAPQIDRTKNIYSIRAVPIPAAFVPALRDYVATKSSLLFPGRNGSPMTKSSFRRFWERIQRAIALEAPEAETLTPHILRHNYATMLYYSDISMKKAARLLGHADVTMIMRIYAHLDESKENAVEKLDKIFN